MIGSPFKLSTEGAPVSGSRRVLDIDVAPDRAGDVANALRDLVGLLPKHPALVPIIDAGVTDGHPFVVIAAAGVEPLDAALHKYGPAEIRDALPRLRRVADALDFVAAQGVCHGALTPCDILIAGDDTLLAGVGVAAALRSVGVTMPRHSPYAAPELGAADISAVADQFSFAAAAYEWLFGRPISVSSEGVHVRSLPDVDGGALATAFNTALAHDPRRRFTSCTAFVTALEHSCPSPQVVGRPPSTAGLPVDDLPMYPTGPDARQITHAPAAALVSEAAPAATPANRGVAIAVMIGAAAVGALIVWLAVRSRNEAADPAIARAGDSFTEAPITSAPPEQPAPAAPPAPVAPKPNPDVVRAAQVEAALLVHTTPAGAAVVIDGVERGVTPVAVRGLALGTRTVVVTRPGYRPSQRLVTLTADRPSRSLDIGLLPAAAGAAPQARARPQAAARDGSLVVDSRPAGAAVTIDGRPAGVTPLTIPSIAPGLHTVRLEHPGYRAVTTTIEVVIGQRARVAARLEGGQDEE